MRAAGGRSRSIVAESKVLAVDGDDAVFLQGDRIVFARRSYARLTALTVYCLGIPLAALAGPPGARVAFFVVGLVAGLGFGLMVLAAIGPLGFRYPLCSIDTRAHVLLNAKHQMIASLRDVEVAANGAGALTIAYRGESFTLMAGDEASRVIALIERARVGDG